MAGFDYDVAIVGSGFGGSVAALRAAEKGYGSASWNPAGAGTTRTFRRPSGICRTSCGSGSGVLRVQRVEYLDDALVLSGADVGGGSQVYANTL
jgi:cholesterol oxidase